MSGTAAYAYDEEQTSAHASPKTFPGGLATTIRSVRSMADEVAETINEPDIVRSAGTLSAPLSRSRIATFNALQEWDGYVVSMKDASFVARLTDLTARGAPDVEEAEIPYDEIDEGSLRRMEVGSLFRWSIGFERSAAGQKTRVSRIVVRQLPRWRKSEIERAEREAEDLAASIEWRDAM